MIILLLPYTMKILLFIEPVPIINEDIIAHAFRHLWFVQDFLSRALDNVQTTENEEEKEEKEKIEEVEDEGKKKE